MINDEAKLIDLILNVNNGEDSIISGKVRVKNNAIIHPTNKHSDIKEELRQPRRIPTKSPYLHPCNSGLDLSSKPNIGNKQKIKRKINIGNNSANNSLKILA